MPTVFNHISIALCVGLTFLNLGNSVADLQYRVFAIFFVTVLPYAQLSLNIGVPLTSPPSQRHHHLPGRADVHHGRK